jgi:hypothetical protein
MPGPRGRDRPEWLPARHRRGPAWGRSAPTSSATGRSSSRRRKPTCLRYCGHRLARQPPAHCHMRHPPPCARPPHRRIAQLLPAAGRSWRSRFDGLRRSPHRPAPVPGLVWMPSGRRGLHQIDCSSHTSLKVLLRKQFERAVLYSRDMEFASAGQGAMPLPHSVPGTSRGNDGYPFCVRSVRIREVYACAAEGLCASRARPACGSNAIENAAPVRTRPRRAVRSPRARRIRFAPGTRDGSAGARCRSPPR